MARIETLTTAAARAEAEEPCDGLPGEMTSCMLAAIQELNGASDLRSGLARVADLLHGALQHDYFSVLLLDELGREASRTVKSSQALRVAGSNVGPAGA
jgi:hypothetical protein